MNCPKCKGTYCYEDEGMWICPECGHEWKEGQVEQEEKKTYRDANGNILVDGDTVALIKDLKVKGATSDLKIGTKVKNIRLVDGDHDIDCYIPGVGAMQLKTQFVKKINE